MPDAHRQMVTWIDADDDGVFATIGKEPNCSGRRASFSDLDAALSAASALAYTHGQPFTVSPNAVRYHVDVILHKRREAQP
jgi:hypothetical protein